ncbi:hypothetical protein OSB04_004214 [Centaurea solstitialis]|uniref:Reverse transcriptase Ty1/copia-type domain-containing protein n=1 Tax=Centaurea solstitialis TaxID=347529 RepID=A0AA38U3S8_9ASTR|nr:hypothetical protein OSB04_004214 [Centaurea solstitialis]
MKDLGNAACILGIRIYQDRTKRLVGFSQSTYLDKILKKIQYETGQDEEKQKVVCRVPTEENLTDPFTKALTRPKHEYHIEAISSNFEMIIFYVLQAEIHRVLLYDSVMLWCTPTLTVTGSYTGYVQSDEFNTYRKSGNIILIHEIDYYPCLRCEIEDDITHCMWVVKSGGSPWRYRVLCYKKVPQKLQCKFYKVIIRPIMLYNIRIRVLDNKKTHEKSLEVAELRMFGQT